MVDPAGIPVPFDNDCCRASSRLLTAMVSSAFMVTTFTGCNYTLPILMMAVAIGKLPTYSIFSFFNLSKR